MLKVKTIIDSLSYLTISLPFVVKFRNNLFSFFTCITRFCIWCYVEQAKHAQQPGQIKKVPEEAIVAGEV